MSLVTFVLTVATVTPLALLTSFVTPKGPRLAEVLYTAFVCATASGLFMALATMLAWVLPPRQESIFNEEGFAVTGFVISRPGLRMMNSYPSIRAWCITKDNPELDVFRLSLSWTDWTGLHRRDRTFIDSSVDVASLRAAIKRWAPAAAELANHFE